MIFIDDREPKRIEEILRKIKAPVYRKRLEVGDYLIAHKGVEVPVERKDANDYLSSIADGRLFAQTHQLSSRYEIAFVCVIGNIDYAIRMREFRKEAVIGSIISIALRRNFGRVIPLFFKNEVEFCYALKSINRMVESGNLKTRPRIIKKGCIDDQIAMLTAIPGIGEEKARRLLEKFGSIQRIVNASVFELMRVEGIGEKQAKIIYDFVRGRQYLKHF